MTLKINYINKNNTKSRNTAIFLTNSGDKKELTKHFDEKIVKKILNYQNSFKKNKKSVIETINLDLDNKLIIIYIDSNLSSQKTENLGANFFDKLKSNKIDNILIIGSNSKDVKKKINFDEFIHGAELKSYVFDLYKTKKSKTLNLNIVKNSNSIDFKLKSKLDAILSGVNFTKDLVSEPGNILHPDEYVNRLLKLKKYGLKITVYDVKKLKKMGCNAIVGVGQGSIRGTYIVTMEWNGKSNSKPLAFVGKGVCFDTGGISLKPARFMEDMTYDMAGSAVVVGLMKNFALRKAKINAVGVVGLVENMPGGNAQRPGDIVKSFSGKTIEVLNTDAEGRLVLADALTLTEKKFKPNLIIDLATLTGAIVVALGSEYAGLFSNDDKLSKQLFEAGEKVEEKVWRLPLHQNYDKLMDSKNADMQNINYIGGAGSTTAAQFLQRFIINKTPWAHLDIAGMAFSKYAGALNSSGATGYGVRLLNKFVEDNYE
ncbi:MAG: leucyl aminopeptidase [Candidatus Pelagibacter sp. TMED273]|nr:MAG: leucyl aminopeptidase [Candidatus Pelagibacter sp. TMED273]